MFEPMLRGDDSFLIAESYGEILMVRVSGLPSYGSFDDFGACVSRADMTEMEWVKVKNLGDKKQHLLCSSMGN